MSPLHAHSLVADLVEMARATEELPKVQAELEHTQEEAHKAWSTVQDRELRIIELKAEIDELNTRVRNAEVARDDAEFRFLESEDKAARVLDKLSGIMGFADSVQRFVRDAREVIEPPKPEPVPETKFDDGGPYNGPQGQSEANPSESQNGGGHSFESIVHSGTSTPTNSTINPTAPVEVATLPDPTVSSTAGDGPSWPTAEATSNADSLTDAASQEPNTTQAEPDPYADEPLAKYSDAWYAWAGEMDRRYGYAWPDRKVA